MEIGNTERLFYIFLVSTELANRNIRGPARLARDSVHLTHRHRKSGDGEILATFLTDCRAVGLVRIDHGWFGASRAGNADLHRRIVPQSTTKSIFEDSSFRRSYASPPCH